MPTYEYACKACGEHLEVVQSFKDDPLTTCPACGGELRKVFGSIGIAFKGPGFYRTDSRTRQKVETGGDGAAKDTGKDTGTGKGKEAGAGSKSGTGSDAGAGSTKSTKSDSASAASS